jgi:hypothetical protein
MLTAYQIGVDNANTQKLKKNSQDFTEADVKAELNSDKSICCVDNDGCILKRTTASIVEANEINRKLKCNIID